MADADAPFALRAAPAIAAALAVLPLARAGDLGRGFLGSPTPDLYDHIFLYRWFRDGLLGGAPWRTATDLLSIPSGGAILMPDPLGGAVYSVLAAALPPALAFNLALLTAIGLGAAAAAWLAGRAGAGAAGRMVAGAAYGGSAYTFAQLHNGETETLQLAALPLCLGLLLDARRAALDGRPDALRRAAVAGAAVAGTFLACWYYGAYACLIAGAGAALTAATLLSRGDRRGALALGAGLAVAGALILPQAVALSRALAAPASLFRMPDVLTVLARDHLALGASSADLAGVVQPGALAASQGYLHGGYLGIVLLAAAAAGLAVAPARARPWAALGAAAFVLALGPRLHVGGAQATLLGAPVELPYLTLAQGLPWFGAMRLPYRCLVLVHLSLGIVAGLGVERLAPGRASIPAAILLSLGLGADVALWSGLPGAPGVVQIPPHPAAGRLGTAPGGVLDLPLRFGEDDRRGVYLAQQGDHGRPVPISLMSSGLSPQVAANPLVIALAAADPHHQARPMDARAGTPTVALAAGIERALYDAPPTEDALAAGAQGLRDAGIAWVVLHRGDAPEADAAEAALLTRWLGPPAVDTPEVAIHAVP